MACLSILDGGGPARCAANPIFLLDPITVRSGEKIRFEVLNVDASELKTLVGAHQCFYIDETSGAFWAQLTSLVSCVGACHGLALLRNKPTLRGVLVVVEEPVARQ